MQVVLVMFRGDGERRSFSVVRNMTIIGRREDCDLRIPVGDVSRKHCRLVRADEGIHIEDLGSSNGTFVNGERVQESELNPGDTIGVGPVQFVVQINGVPDEAEIAAPTVKPATQPAESADPEDSMMSDHAHGSLPEESFSLDEAEPAMESSTPLMELDELPVDELPMSETPGGEEPEFEIEDKTIDEVPAAPPRPKAVSAPASKGPPPLKAVVPAVKAPPPLKAVVPDPIDVFEEFDLEELPDEESAHSVAPPIAGAPVDEPVVGDSLDDLAFEDDAPAMPGHLMKHAPAAEDALEELEFEDEQLDLAPFAKTPAPLASAAAEPTDSLEELELDESPRAQAGTESVEPPARRRPISPPPPAFHEAETEAAAAGSEEPELDEHHTANGHAPKAESDSSWDFVMEETDAARSHHDFKVDIDAPHEQPHG